MLPPNDKRYTISVIPHGPYPSRVFLLARERFIKNNVFNIGFYVRDCKEVLAIEAFYSVMSGLIVQEH